MVLGLQSGDVVKVLNNSVLTVLFRLTRSRDHLYAFVHPEFVLLKEVILLFISVFSLLKADKP